MYGGAAAEGRAPAILGKRTAIIIII